MSGRADNEILLATTVVQHAVDIGHHRASVVVGSSALQSPEQIELQVAWFEDIATRQRGQLSLFEGVNEFRSYQNDEFLLACN